MVGNQKHTIPHTIRLTETDSLAASRLADLEQRTTSEWLRLVIEEKLNGIAARLAACEQTSHKSIS